jgi:hypothetical protein
MGERLVINIQDEQQNSLMTLYYHWSGYTQSTLDQINDLMLDMQNEVFDDQKETIDLSIEDKLYYYFKAAWSEGARPSGDKWQKEQMPYLERMFSHADLTRMLIESPGADRNNGLINMDEDGMESTIGYAEHLMHITIREHGEDLVSSPWEAFWGDLLTDDDIGVLVKQWDDIRAGDLTPEAEDIEQDWWNIVEEIQENKVDKPTNFEEFEEWLVAMGYVKMDGANTADMTYDEFHDIYSMVDSSYSQTYFTEYDEEGLIFYREVG